MMIIDLKIYYVYSDKITINMLLKNCGTEDGIMF